MPTDLLKSKQEIRFNIGSTVKESTYNLYGFVTLRLIRESGEVQEYASNNTITYIGRHHLSRVVCGSQIAEDERAINVLKVSGGAVLEDGNHLNPTPTSFEDEGLFETDPTKIKMFSLSVPVFNPVSNSVQSSATFTKLISSTDVDLLLNEMGLFFGATGPIFAHYTFPTLDLRAESRNSLEISWQLKI